MPDAPDHPAPDHPTPEAPEILYAESGASWLWLLSGPAAGLTMLLLQLKGGGGFSPALPLMFLVLVTGFVALQIHAARIHTCVELTTQTLKQGAEITDVHSIIGVYPEKQRGLEAGSAQARTQDKWLESRHMGELSRVPRGRTAVGIGLAGGRTARAWARRHRDLRAALTKLVGEMPVAVVDKSGDDKSSDKS